VLDGAKFARVHGQAISKSCDRALQQAVGNDLRTKQLRTAIGPIGDPIFGITFAPSEAAERAGSETLFALLEGDRLRAARVQPDLDFDSAFARSGNDRILADDLEQVGMTLPNRPGRFCSSRLARRFPPLTDE
jgi:hypothetical protein